MWPGPLAAWLWRHCVSVTGLNWTVASSAGGEAYLYPGQVQMCFPRATSLISADGTGSHRAAQVEPSNARDYWSPPRAGHVTPADRPPDRRHSRHCCCPFPCSDLHLVHVSEACMLAFDQLELKCSQWRNCADQIIIFPPLSLSHTQTTHTHTHTHTEYTHTHTHRVHTHRVHTHTHKSQDPHRQYILNKHEQSQWIG